MKITFLKGQPLPRLKETVYLSGKLIGRVQSIKGRRVVVA